MRYNAVMFRTATAILFVVSLFLAAIKFLEMEYVLESVYLGWLPIDWIPMKALVAVMIVTGLILAAHSLKKQR